jgi:uncharacterized protein (TIGR00288 family)
MADESLIAVFVDFENLAIGSRDMHEGGFRIDLVLKRLLEKGRIVFKRAYCDWNRYRGAVRDFHGQGIEMVDIPAGRMSGKNSADIRMVVDALDLCYSKDHIDTFALLTGDSDFSPLVNKLKENNKRVIGCGVMSSTSELLVSSCDEFLYYDDIVRTEATTRKKVAARSGRSRSGGAAGSRRKATAAPAEELVTTTPPEPAAIEANAEAKPAAKRSRGGRGRSSKKKTAEAETPVVAVEEAEVVAAEEAKPARGRGRRSTKKKVTVASAESDTDSPSESSAPATESVVESPANTEGLDKLLAIVASLAQDYDPVWGSLVKQTLRRVHPDFREEHYGYASFVEMLKDAEARSLVTLEYDTSRGNYKIRVR